MDPTATLIAIRALVKVIHENNDSERWEELATDLAEVAEALDGWMTRGGFLPVQWRSLLRSPQ